MCTDWEGRNKPVFVRRWHGCLCRKKWRNQQQNIPFGTSGYSKVLGYRVEVQKSVAFLCITN